MKKNVIIEIICLLFIILFVYAAANKLLDVEKFRVQLGQSPLIATFAGVLAWIVPIMEIFISIALATPRFRLFGFYASFTLMAVFTIYIVAMLNLSPFVPCSCGGILEKLGWTEHLIFNSCFVALALLGIMSYPKKRIENIDQNSNNANALFQSPKI